MKHKLNCPAYSNYQPPYFDCTCGEENMTNLHAINFGVNQFCGPAVMSALTGKSTDECAAVISAVSGRQEIKAVQVAHLIEAFKRLKFEMKELPRLGYSLFTNLSALSNKPGMYIVLVPKHVVAVEVTEDKKLYLVDNHSKDPLPAEGSARLSQKCDKVYKITELPKPQFLRTEIFFTRNMNSISIYAKDIYDTEVVNRGLGHIYYKDENELSRIILNLYTNLIPKK